jgi:poly(ribitol-phosphate) beta-N-acetylglucosaminyltransferase
MPVDVSVIVPFFNPGANIDDCLQSLLDQTLSRDRFDVVLVDDGSTDGSGARVAAWVSRHPDLMRMHRIPASGGPGRPRNVAMDRSYGRYIQFLDSDDTLAARALERMLDIADSSNADVVVGKLSSDFRGIHHQLFRHTVTGRTLDDFPLMRNLTVCKMFRRDFMTTHGVRFPEGPHYIEDQHLCMQSYVRAQSVAVVGDTACYFYRRRRTGGRNFGDSTIVLADYYRELGAILDIVDAEVSSEATRLAVQSRFYSNEMLGRLRGQAMQSYDVDYRRELVSQVRHLAIARFSPELHEALPMFDRTQSRLLLNDDLDGLIEFARRLAAVRLRATTPAPRWQDGNLVVDIDAPMSFGDEPLRLEQDKDGWLLPQRFAPGIDAGDRRLRSSDEPDLDLATVSRADSQLWSTTHGLTLRLDGEGCPRVEGTVSLDPATVMGGGRLSPGVWDLRLRVTFGGMARSSPLRPATDVRPDIGAWLSPAGSAVQSIAAFWTRGSPSLSLDVDEWSHSLHDLLTNPNAGLARIDRHRHLVIAAPGWRGRTGDHTTASLILEPLDSPGLAVVHCGANLRIGTDGTSIEATLPDLPRTAAHWAVWLRLGDIGGSPPRPLPIRLAATRSGKLRLVSAG